MVNFRKIGWPMLETFIFSGKKRVRCFPVSCKIFHENKLHRFSVAFSQVFRGVRCLVLLLAMVKGLEKWLEKGVENQELGFPESTKWPGDRVKKTRVENQGRTGMVQVGFYGHLVMKHQHGNWKSPIYTLYIYVHKWRISWENHLCMLDLPLPCLTIGG